MAVFNVYIPPPNQVLRVARRPVNWPGSGATGWRASPRTRPRFSSLRATSGVAHLLQFLHQRTPLLTRTMDHSCLALTWFHTTTLRLWRLVAVIVTSPRAQYAQYAQGELLWLVFVVHRASSICKKYISFWIQKDSICCDWKKVIKNPSRNDQFLKAQALSWFLNCLHFLFCSLHFKIHF